jgi:hypothetical protein
MARYLTLHAQMAPPFGAFDRAALGAELGAELDTVRRLWLQCGYRPGIGAYLNFFLMRDFITLHDEVFPARFASFRPMARSFYATDLFIRAVTDSGRQPSGGLQSPSVRAQLAAIMRRHAALSIPSWMMTYFGYSLLQNVEKQCSPSPAESRRHLAYMAKVYRTMGMPFAEQRELLDQFACEVESAQAGATPQLEQHARDILVLGEMVGVSSKPASILPMLSAAARAVFAPILPRVRPGALRRLSARGAGRLLMPRAVGRRPGTPRSRA